MCNIEAYCDIYISLIDILFSHPIISPVKLGQLLGVHYTTASRHLKAIAEAGYLGYWKRRINCLGDEAVAVFQA